jgi:hypothetical protein
MRDFSRAFVAALLELTTPVGGWAGSGFEAGLPPARAAMSLGPGRGTLAAEGNPAPSGCAGLSGYSQPFNSASYGFANTSDAEFGYRVAESALDESDAIAALGDGAIASLRWWGLSWEYDLVTDDWASYCGEDDAANTPFELIFYADDAGAPGEPLAIRRGVVPSHFLTNVPWNDFTIAEYAATVSPPVDATNVAWVSVQREWGQDTAGGNPCIFLWVNEETTAYDDFGAQWSQFPIDFPVAYDFTYCVDVGAAAPSYLDVFYGDFEYGDRRYWVTSPP